MFGTDVWVSEGPVLDRHAGGGGGFKSAPSSHPEDLRPLQLPVTCPIQASLSMRSCLHDNVRMGCRVPGNELMEVKWREDGCAVSRRQTGEFSTERK